jgi:two-component system C4-dicarboxylate transport response regulator DctD
MPSNAILNYRPDSLDSKRLTTARTNRTVPEIMIVEDEPFSRRLLEKLLPPEFKVTSLGEADDMLSRYAITVPDILFLDINLPHVNGHELLERVLALDPNAFVIMISGNADRQNVLKAMQRGASGFVAKPFSRDRLFEYIRRCPTLPAEFTHAHS